MTNNVISTKVEVNQIKNKRKVYETGDHKNVANLESFIATIQTLGNQYNPAKDLLKLTNLETIRTESNEILTQLYSLQNVWTTRVTERAEVIDRMDKYVTRLSNAYKLYEDNSELLKDFMALVRKLKGKRAKAVDKEAVKAGDKVIHSVSQYSFDSRIANLTKVLDMLSNNANYAPNEDDLKVEAVQEYLDDLKTKNSKFIQINTEIGQARIERDKKFYTTNRSLVPVTRQVKMYLDSILDKKHPVNQKLKKIVFTQKYMRN